MVAWSALWTWHSSSSLSASSCAWSSPGHRWWRLHWNKKELFHPPNWTRVCPDVCHTQRRMQERAVWWASLQVYIIMAWQYGHMKVCTHLTCRACLPWLSAREHLYSSDATTTLTTAPAAGSQLVSAAAAAQRIETTSTIHQCHAASALPLLNYGLATSSWDIEIM